MKHHVDMVSCEQAGSTRRVLCRLVPCLVGLVLSGAANHTLAGQPASDIHADKTTVTTGNPADTDPARRRAFLHAAAMGDLPGLQKLLDQGVSPDTTSRDRLARSARTSRLRSRC